MKRLSSFRIAAIAAAIMLASVITFAGCKSVPEPKQIAQTGIKPSVYEAILDAQDAADYIVEQIHTKRLVFIGEEHMDVRSVLFLADNLRKFYDAGVRYLFVEGGTIHELSNMPGTPGYMFISYYPWSETSWRYDWRKLANAIHDINSSVPESEQLQLINPEAGYNPTTEELIADPAGNIDKRDAAAYQGVISFLDDKPAQHKAIMFYGSTHGAMTEHRNPNAIDRMWKPAGTFLSQHYGNEYVAIGSPYILADMLDEMGVIPLATAEADSNQPLTAEQLDSLSAVQKIASVNADGEMTLRPADFHDTDYTANRLEGNSLYGIFYNYAPTHENLQYMFDNLGRLESSMDTWKTEEVEIHDQDMGQYLLHIYYLKLWFGDQFDYQLWNGTKSLNDSLASLKNTVFTSTDGSTGDAATKIVLSVSTDAMHEYHRYMETGRWLEAYTNNWENFKDPNSTTPLNELIPEWLSFVIDNMKKASTYFPDDLWPYYWLGWAYTDTEDYAAALTAWEHILASPLSRCMETLPIVYRQAAKCYAAMGNQAKSDEYTATANGLTNEHGLDFSHFKDIK